ncbi:hypothetical protein HPB49_011008 [Dermacentor silvarum]|uniref:Uncharacterized protein n=1 Tax=Dermacentor silvarum TaxID=543639 RepID=A0ACB8DZT7_DERSI|nr:hypothetical protein HPB49_011008 [Dermacentor silvarum]
MVARNGAVVVRGTRSGASDGTVGGAEGVVRDALFCHREQASVGSEETIRRVSQSTGSECVRRVAEAVVNAGVRNKCDHFPKTSEEKAAVKEGFLRRSAIPGVIGCTDGGLIATIAPKGERNTAFMSSKGYYVENCMFCQTCTAVDIRIIDMFVRLLIVPCKTTLISGWKRNGSFEADEIPVWTLKKFLKDGEEGEQEFARERVKVWNGLPFE